MQRYIGGRSFDEMLEALGDVQRRKLLVALLEHDPQDDAPVVLEESKKDSDNMERLVMMDSVHLPKLAEYGFIDWNEQTHEVARGPNFDEIRPLLELLKDYESQLPPGLL